MSLPTNETPPVPVDGTDDDARQGLIRLKARALGLLSRREHTRRELERKLRGHEQAPGQLTQALDDLQAKGYLDNTRAAASYVHRKAGKLGGARMRREMQELGLGREQIEQAMSVVAAPEQDRATEVWRRKYGAQPPVDARDRARQQRFLLARGFSAEVVRRLLGSAGQAEAASDA